MNPPGVTVVDLSKRYDLPSTEALEAVSLHAPAGQVTAVIGPSGCGKSTLLRIVAGLEEPTSGNVTMGGRSPHEVRRAKEVAWMAQAPALLPWLSVVDNVALAQRINPRPARDLPEPRHLLELVDLLEFAGAYPGALSGGMQQRAALARTMAIGAPLWLMDEPFSAVDEMTREHLGAELLALRDRVRPTVLWVTHNVAEATRLADRVVVLSARPGQVVGVVDIDAAHPRHDHDVEIIDAVRHIRSMLRSTLPQGTGVA